MSTPMIGQNSPLARLRTRTRDSVSTGPKSSKRTAPKQLSAREREILAIILEKPMDFMDSEEFLHARAEQRIYSKEEIQKPDVTWYRPLMDDLLPNRGGGNRQGKSILLSGQQERILFLKFNYARYRIRVIQDKLGNSRPDLKKAREILHWYEIVNRYRQQIAETNLALVLAMAKRTRMSEIDFADLVSEGNMALLRSVDKFDCERGFKFSTYACRAILKAFSRHGMKFSKYRQRFPTDFDPSLEKSDYLETLRALHVEESAAEVRHIVISNEADLTEVERTVIHHRFGIEAQEDHSSLTLEQVGQIIGVTKERVRQIQNKALQKIREALNEISRDDLPVSEN